MYVYTYIYKFSGIRLKWLTRSRKISFSACCFFIAGDVVGCWIFPLLHETTIPLHVWIWASASTHRSVWNVAMLNISDWYKLGSALLISWALAACVTCLGAFFVYIEEMRMCRSVQFDFALSSKLVAQQFSNWSCCPKKIESNVQQHAKTHNLKLQVDNKMIWIIS